ncbi:MAG: hypothetical protein Q9225_004575 [Loekoesia sp. 1 TL-2023]
MFGNGNVNHVVNPITALAFVPSQSGVLLLAGEGPYLKVFDHETAQLAEVKRVFESQTIHGIITTKNHSGSDGSSVTGCLIWGGRCFRTCELHKVAKDGQSKIEIRFAEEHEADDWILDASLRPGISLVDPSTSLEKCNAVLVTAHNVAFTFHHDGRVFTNLKRIAAGSRSMLYSACIEWTTGKRILVASGTVFGEVLFWSFSESALDADADLQIQSQLHCKFTGHEGSVFGVGISPRLSGVNLADKRQMLASCSDDRTIRIWDVDNLEGNDVLLDGKQNYLAGSAVPSDDSKVSVSEDRCIATVMGHTSRIWNVRFLKSKDRFDVSSFGEDSTVQVWQLVEKPGTRVPPFEKPKSQQLIHRQTYAYHSGKNIWASAVLQRQDGLYAVCTGGADGRIVSYDIYSSDEGTSEESLHGLWTMKDVVAHLEESKIPKIDDADGPELKTKDVLSKHIFNDLEGTWIIKRDIRSALPAYPSGTFIGEAIFKERSPSTSDFNEEYLYTEQGTFNADQGLSFAATRQYVYRYRRSSDIISAWFVKPDDRSTVDYLFHELCLDDKCKLKDGNDSEGGLVVKASGYHLCADDHYTPDYTFRLKNDILQDWKLAYQVRGPQKDYTAKASYVRKSNGHERSTTKTSEETASAVTRAQRNQIRFPDVDELGNDGFKSYVFLAHDHFMVTTAQGRILLGSLTYPWETRGKVQHSDEEAVDIRWEVVSQFEALKLSSITTRAMASDLVLFGGNDGTVFLRDDSSKEIRPIFELGRKVAFLYAQKSSTEEYVVFATCLGRPIGYVYNFNRAALASYENDLHARPLLLSLPPSFIVTSAFYIEEIDMWVLGSRNGAMAFYDASLLSTEMTSPPNRVLQGIHGEDAITVIHCLPEQRAGELIYVLTAARDGHYAVHTIAASQRTLEQRDVTFRIMHRSMAPFGPNIEGATFDPQSQDLLLWGFRSKQFVVWNASKNTEIMNVECGGAHRSWSFIPRNDGSDGGSFVWTKASVCCVYSQAHASHRVFQPGGHGRDIKAMAISPSLKTPDGSLEQYIATGAEDTAIRIWSYNNEYDSEIGFKCLGTFTKHTTGIQRLCWSDDGQVLFSAAGCEEFFAWRVQPVPFIGIGAVCEAVCPTVSEDRDLRIMDFCFEELTDIHRDDDRNDVTYLVSIVYSDSSLRIFRYTSQPLHPHFTLLYTSTYATNCLTQTLYLHPTLDTKSTRHYLCTASSDGHIAFWPADIAFFDPQPQLRSSLQYSHRHRIHQSSIKCMLASQIYSNQYLLISVGDDGAIGITRLAFSYPARAAPTCSTLIIPKAHAAAINAVTYVQTLPGSPDTHVFATSGNDQKVRTWGVSCRVSVPGMKGISVELRGERYTSVADVPALCSMKVRDDVNVLVAGIGMECVRAVERSLEGRDGDNAEK